MPGTPVMIDGYKARTNLYTNREDTDFDTGIALLDPNVNPMTLITMDLSKGSVDTVEHRWWEDELVPETLQNNAGTETAIDATAILLSYDTTTSGDHEDRCKQGDLIMHNQTREVMLVHTVVTATHIIGVVRNYGGGALAAAIGVDDYMTVIGNAFEQGHALPDMRSTQEITYVNYCQDMRTPFGITEIAEETKMRGEAEWPYQRKKNGIQHSRKLEYMNWWGRPLEGGKAKFSSWSASATPTAAGGINHFIVTNSPAAQKEDQDEITSDEFQDFMEYVFQYGSGTKVCYCPPRLRTALDKWGISKLNTFTRDTMYGMAVAKWLSSHGEVIFITHKMLNEPESGEYFYNFFLDMEELQWRTFGSNGATRLRVTDPYAASGATLKAEEYQTVGSMKVGLAPTHSRLRFKTIGA